GDDACEPGVTAQRRDVVHELGSELERAGGDLRLRGVDRHRSAFERLEHRYYASQLLLRRDGVCARPGRLATDVHDPGTLVELLPRGSHGGAGLEIDPAVRERVRSHVDDAHDGRARKSLLDGWVHEGSVV